MSTRTITKSVRLTPEESETLAQLSEQTAATEAALMKQWIRDGIRAKKLDLAIHAYMERHVDLRGAAAMAGISYNRFMHELEARHIVVLDVDRFLDRLMFLADAFDDETLRTAAKERLGLGS